MPDKPARNKATIPVVVGLVAALINVLFAGGGTTRFQLASALL